MKNKSKILALILSLMICLTMFSINAYAVGESDGDIGGGSSQEDPGYNDQPVDPAPDDGDSDNDNPGYDDGGSGDDGNNSDDGNSDYENPDSGYSDNNGDDYNNGYNNGNDDNSGYDDGYNNDYNNDYNSYDNYDYNDNNSYNAYNYDSDSYGDGGYSDYDSQNYDEPDLYKTDGNIDVNVLSDSDWNAIAQSLKDAENNSDDDDVGDFNFIKKNNSSSDNGLWMLILGSTLIILSFVGIGYMIITYINKKKNLAFAGTDESYSSDKKPSKYYKAKNDYDDGFSTTKSNSKKSLGRKRMDDTADIILPKNKSNKNGGRRYR